MSGYIAYIDESGCDGFSQASSEFLVIGAIVMRRSRFDELELAESRVLSELRAQDPNRHPNWKFKTFKKLNNTPSQRWLIATEFAKVPCNAIAVAVHKKHLQLSSWQANTDNLYFKASQFLAERISWACRDADARQPESNKRCEIIFSQRGTMRYNDFQENLRSLRDNRSSSSNADWNFLDPDLVSSSPHYDSSLGHMIVDHFVSAIGCALEEKSFGMYDDRYARIWCSRLYRSGNNVLKNGIKFWPDDGLSDLKESDRGFWLKNLG